MKKWVHSKRDIIDVEWDIEIRPRESKVAASSILDTQSNEYQAFIKGMVANFMEYGYELYNDPEYTHKSNKGSESWYYTFLKIEDYVEIRVIVNVRISDHSNPDRPWGTAEELRNNYTNKISNELAKEFEVSPSPMRVPVEIIFNDRSFTSYTRAIFYLCDQLRDVEADYQEWRKENGLPPSDAKGDIK